jgi:hypothetical protein
MIATGNMISALGGAACAAYKVVITILAIHIHQPEASNRRGNFLAIMEQIIVSRSQEDLALCCDSSWICRTLIDRSSRTSDDDVRIRFPCRPSLRE